MSTTSALPPRRLVIVTRSLNAMLGPYREGGPSRSRASPTAQGARLRERADVHGLEAQCLGHPHGRPLAGAVVAAEQHAGALPPNRGLAMCCGPIALNALTTFVPGGPLDSVMWTQQPARLRTPGRPRSPMTRRGRRQLRATRRRSASATSTPSYAALD